MHHPKNSLYPVPWLTQYTFRHNASIRNRTLQSRWAFWQSLDLPKQRLSCERTVSSETQINELAPQPRPFSLLMPEGQFGLFGFQQEPSALKAASARAPKTTESI